MSWALENGFLAAIQEQVSQPTYRGAGISKGLKEDTQTMGGTKSQTDPCGNAPGWAETAHLTGPSPRNTGHGTRKRLGRAKVNMNPNTAG